MITELIVNETEPKNNITQAITDELNFKNLIGQGKKIETLDDLLYYQELMRQLKEKVQNPFNRSLCSDLSIVCANRGKTDLRRCMTGRTCPNMVTEWDLKGGK
jgi:hypothetical protein